MACLVAETFFPVDDSVGFDVVVTWLVGLVATNSRRLLRKCFVFLCRGDPIPRYLIHNRALRLDFVHVAIDDSHSLPSFFYPGGVAGFHGRR